MINLAAEKTVYTAIKTIDELDAKFGLQAYMNTFLSEIIRKNDNGIVKEDEVQVMNQVTSDNTSDRSIFRRKNFFLQVL